MVDLLSPFSAKIDRSPEKVTDTAQGDLKTQTDPGSQLKDLSAPKTSLPDLTEAQREAAPNSETAIDGPTLIAPILPDKPQVDLSPPAAEVKREISRTEVTPKETVTTGPYRNPLFTGTVDAASDGEFSWRQAGANILHGVWDSVKGLVTTKNGWLAIAGAAAVAATGLVTAPVATGIAAGYFLFKAGQFGVNLYLANQAGDMDAAERSFRHVGEGSLAFAPKVGKIFRPIVNGLSNLRGLVRIPSFAARTAEAEGGWLQTIKGWAQGAAGTISGIKNHLTQAPVKFRNLAGRIFSRNSEPEAKLSQPEILEKARSVIKRSIVPAAIVSDAIGNNEQDNNIG